VTLSLVKWPEREADHSPPSSAEVKEWVELHFNFPNKPSWRGTQLNHRDNFTFTFNVLYGMNMTLNHIFQSIKIMFSIHLFWGTNLIDDNFLYMYHLYLLYFLKTKCPLHPYGH
jgi:hypothetical protein